MALTLEDVVLREADVGAQVLTDDADKVGVALGEDWHLQDEDQIRFDQITQIS